jgi:hypothetical protein
VKTGKACCGNVGYSPPQACCDKTVYTPGPTAACCNNKKVYNPTTQKCCADGKICGKAQTCCNGACCNANQPCCGGKCCAANQICLNNLCCNANQVLCGGVCCDANKCCNGVCNGVVNQCQPGQWIQVGDICEQDCMFNCQWGPIWQSGFCPWCSLQLMCNCLPVCIPGTGNACMFCDPSSPTCFRTTCPPGTTCSFVCNYGAGQCGPVHGQGQLSGQYECVGDDCNGVS